MIIEIDNTNNLNLCNEESGVNSGLTCQENLNVIEPPKIFE